MKTGLAVIAVLAGALAGVAPSASGSAPTLQSDGLTRARRNLMPVPQSVRFRGEPLSIGRGFSVAVRGPASGVEPRIERAVGRLLARIALQTGIPIPPSRPESPSRADLLIEYVTAAADVQTVSEDESYTLDVAEGRAQLRAPTPYGVLRGIETFLQLIEVRRSAASEASGDSVDLAAEPRDFIVPGVEIRDAPRFPWRGLLIDPGRHHLPVEVIKRNLDAMAAVKLNVLHWHLSEDQGFRVESLVFPKLHELGSDGQYYSQAEITEIVDYARDRGIRVLPEFDMPGHATSWFVGYPQLASAPGPYSIIETWGIQDPAMDPTREETYEFLDTFIGEMAALFSDPYFHIGGDEVNGEQWDANPEIQRFITENDLGDNSGLQAHFNRRVQAILQRHGKAMIGWDEIFYPGLPDDIVVQSWRGQESLAAGARQGYSGILSNGYYIDLMYPAGQHYLVDPVGEQATGLTASERARILGGEACMWGEYVVGETIDSRIWPRTAAIAERLWSSASVVEIDDMYRRLAATSRWLTWVGVEHRSGYALMLDRLAGDMPSGALRALADVVEPIKGYRRGRTRSYTRFTPLNRLVDAVRPESAAARRFQAMVAQYLELMAVGTPTPADAAIARRAELAATLRSQLDNWRDNHPGVVQIARRSSLLPEAESLSAQLEDLAAVGLEALDSLDRGELGPVGERVRQLRRVEDADAAHGALRIMVVEAVRQLVEAAFPSP